MINIRIYFAAQRRIPVAILARAYYNNLFIHILYVHLHIIKTQGSEKPLFSRQLRVCPCTSSLRMLSDRPITCVNDSHNYTVALMNRHLHNMVRTFSDELTSILSYSFRVLRLNACDDHKDTTPTYATTCAMIMHRVKFYTQSYKHMQLKSHFQFN